MNERLAINGGTPVRTQPFGPSHDFGDEDIAGKEGPLYRNPFLSEPDCYGHSRFPFDYGREKPIDYRLTECPYGEALMRRGVNLSMLPSFADADVADIVRAIRKVAAHYR